MFLLRKIKKIVNQFVFLYLILTYMSNINFMICGCVRNCENYLENVFENIKKIQNELNVIKIVLAYDESNDKTLYKLCQLKKNKDFDIEIIINKDKLTQYRTLNISNARNKLLEYIYDYKINIDYFIMMDFDDVCSKPININVLKESLKIKNKWDCVTFNNKNYYDFWALSLDNYIFSCWHWNKPREIIKYMYKCFKEKMNNAEMYIECDSAFNGFGIYKTKSFKHCLYNPVINPQLLDLEKIVQVSKKTNIKPFFIKNKLDCEHRNFHLLSKKINNSKIIIFKKNLFPPYEGEHSSFLRK